MKKIFNLILLFALTVPAVRAQDEVPPPIPAYQALSDAQLDQLLGPIALYPDPLISEILPASTFPTEIVLADRYVTSGGDPNAIDQQPWDPSVQALAHYPQVLNWMDNNLNWTTQLGQAFQNQQQDVMDSIQRLRLEAYNLGNLQSTPQQQVVDDNGYIEILPASPDNVYVPEYQPDQVYYDQPYGTPFITFSVGYILGPWLYCDFDWHNHHLIFWDRDHPRANGWWHQRPDWNSASFAGHTTVWNPAHRPAMAAGAQGDRGWNTTQNRGWIAPPVSRPPPAPEHFEQSNQRSQDNAFIGSDNARDARAFSERGQQSTGNVGAPSHEGGAPEGGGPHGGVGGASEGGGPRGGGGGAPPTGGGGGERQSGGGGGGGGGRH